MTDVARRVLLLATTTGYQIRSFGEAAAKLGVKLVFATDRCDKLDDPWWDQAIPVRFHDEQQSVAAIIDAVASHPPNAVLAVGDRPTRLAALAARALGLPGNPPDAAAASRNKLMFRRALDRAGMPVPRFTPFSAATDPLEVANRVSYPSVVKPLAQSGSRGVIRVNDPTECAAAFARVAKILASVDVRLERDPAHDTILVERFIPGREYACEGLLHEGRLRITALFDKPDPLDGPFFEETIYVTPSHLSPGAQARVHEAVAAAVEALGLREGPIHAECRIDGTDVYVLEVAARPIGGLCARALRFAAVDASLPALDMISLEELLLRHALGEDVEGFAVDRQAAGVMMIPIPRGGLYRGVTGTAEARATQFVEDVTITARPDQLLVPPPEGRSYLGFIFARAETPLAVEAALREAHVRLTFRIDRALV